eukprot:TRINITY_DN1337_c0_g1_i3.p1 TRINITY_DN1337_c0_g1~~TRINITY_DN1337_c0_g1_i3.p1  ORF type:complete len:251 (-),score=80.66 TRINITY_DN1337_c0_g1_i3:171-923(-)
MSKIPEELDAKKLQDNAAQEHEDDEDLEDVEDFEDDEDEDDEDDEDEDDEDEDDEDKNASEAEKQFDAELKAKKAETNRVPVIVRRFEPGSDSDEDRRPTLAELRALPIVWVTHDCWEQVRTVGRQLDRVGCDDEFDYLRMTNTASSYEAFEIFAEHLARVTKALKAKNKVLAFNIVFAITYVFKNDDFWYLDTDCPEEAEALLKKLRNQWKKFLKLSDEELQLYPGDREAIAIMLQDFKKDVAAVDMKF